MMGVRKDLELTLSQVKQAKEHIERARSSALDIDWLLLFHAASNLKDASERITAIANEIKELSS